MCGMCHGSVVVIAMVTHAIQVVGHSRICHCAAMHVLRCFRYSGVLADTGHLLCAAVHTDDEEAD